MLLKNACDKPVPSVRGIEVGIDDGMIHPARARTITIGLNG